MKNSEYRGIFRWLQWLQILILVMILVGGITRLTRSGLSIVEWNPIVGTLPPLTEADWQSELLKYQQTPEGQIINSGINLDDYKKIFFWEYLHRLLGRVIFLWSLLPGLYYARKGLLSWRQVFLLPSLVALQGVVGWLMVKSGLNQRPSVSHYMLAVHFFSALILLASIKVLRWRLKLNVVRNALKGIGWKVYALSGLLLLQILWGCFVGGLQAGYVSNTFPLMNGKFFPSFDIHLQPVVLNFLEYPPVVHWTHRWLGISWLLSFGFFYWRSYREGTGRLEKKILNKIFFLLGLQVTLGILTIALWVPIYLAAAHQVVACLLFLAWCDLFLLHGQHYRHKYLKESHTYDEI